PPLLSGTAVTIHLPSGLKTASIGDSPAPRGCKTGLPDDTSHTRKPSDLDVVTICRASELKWAVATSPPRDKALTLVHAGTAQIVESLSDVVSTKRPDLSNSAARTPVLWSR